ncbi:MAG: mannose-6-phosphate isomerase, partial [Bacteroidetes bacterium HGW-Bacteroidetes-15]
MLYPIKFSPILKERIWGGTRLKNDLGKKYPQGVEKCGESWELSGVEGNVSVVSNGYLSGNTLEELIEVYMGDLVGEKVYNDFGHEFPLLIKLIDTSDFLSLQVHPDDEMAKRLHHAYGKSEFWYVLDGEPDSTIITGFTEELTKEQFQDIVKSGDIAKFLKHELAHCDNFYYIPSGQVHALGKGIMLVEIQQTSDITYRIYDWDRVDDKGVGRELHLDLAADAINFEAKPFPSQNLPIELNQIQSLGSYPYFSTNRLVIDKVVERDFFKIDSFRIYICIEGEVDLNYFNGEDVTMIKGELVLIPASIS